MERWMGGKAVAEPIRTHAHASAKDNKACGVASVRASAGGEVRGRRWVTRGDGGGPRRELLGRHSSEQCVRAPRFEQRLLATVQTDLLCSSARHPSIPDPDERTTRGRLSQVEDSWGERCVSEGGSPAVHMLVHARCRWAPEASGWPSL
ncbi:Hypothetical predicted protein [Cloeon dipterum]|uniref:Uncharacterized protein n=1 Tax=Cloeon dipterum TaxID=197152 RepID=A0A8S1DU61_9INSE|nr:Hypothetical predicted protein [Cloeon dipterum]